MSQRRITDDLHALLGETYMMKGLKKDALSNWEMAIQLGDTGSIHNAAVLLLNGFYGFPSQPQKALKYYKLGAHLEHAESAYAVGLILKNGVGGIAIQANKANIFFKLAKKLGYPVESHLYQ